MSFLTTVPAELAAAAAQLGAIGSALAAQSAGIAAPTTAIAPAAADQVSILQSSIFTAYGTLYQQLAGEAQAIQEQFVQTLGLSSGTYQASEAANAAAAQLSSAVAPAASVAAQSSPVDDFLTNVATLFGGPLTSVGGQPFSLSGNSANIGSFQFGNFASATSDLFGMAGGGLLPAATADVGADAADVAGAADLAGATGPAGAGMGGMPMAAGLGQATMVGNLSVPPSWAGPASLVSSTTPATMSGAGWTAAAPTASAPGGFYPGMPGMASAGRGGAGFGAPRYGVKPIVMSKAV
jgi:PE family/PPE-SVP subfamily C-terminal region